MLNSLSHSKMLQTAGKNQKRALEIIQELNITDIWQKYGCKANLIGSLATGLLMKNRDIDFHIYSKETFSIDNSFKAIAEIAQNKQIKRITYDNLLDMEDMCLEWHAYYEDQDGLLWQIDMIHIKKESPYAGMMEKVAERISTLLTPEITETILQIKYDTPDDVKIMGIEVYKAVIQNGVKNYREFIEWRKTQPSEKILTWMP